MDIIKPWTVTYHARDCYIRFNEAKHLYRVDWKHNGRYTPIKKSVTSFIGDFFPKFNPGLILRRMRAKKYGKNKYGSKTDVEIKAEWKKSGDDAREAGTRLHNTIETFYNQFRDDEELDDPCFRTDDIQQEWDQFLHFVRMFEKKGLVPFRCEWIIYSDIKYKMCGAVDMLFVKEVTDDGRLILVMVDWKRTKKLSLYGMKETGTGPCSNVPNANFFKYSLQLNTYKYIIESYYKDIEYNGVIYKDIVISDMMLIVFHTNREKYMMRKCPNMQKIVHKMLETI